MRQILLLARLTGSLPVGLRGTPQEDTNVLSKKGEQFTFLIPAGEVKDSPPPVARHESKNDSLGQAGRKKPTKKCKNLSSK